MAILDPYLCLACGRTSAADAFCSACGKRLSIPRDKLTDLIARRLAAEGFTDLQTASTKGELLAPLAGRLEKELADDYERFLIFPSSSGGSSYVYNLFLLGFIRGRESSAASINELATRSYGVIRDNVRALRDLKINSSFFRLYVIYNDGCSSDTVRLHKLPWRSRRSFRPISNLIIKPIDVKKKKVYGGGGWLPDKHVKLAVKQIAPTPDVSGGASFHLRFAKELFYLPLRKLSEYWDNVNLLGSPTILAHRITSNKLTAKDLAATIGLSAFLSALIGSLFKLEQDGIDLGFPLIDRALQDLLLIVGIMLGASLNHLPLKLAGGKATFRTTFVSTAYVSAVATPLVTLIVGVFTLLGASDMQGSASAAYAAVGLPVYTGVHRLSLKRTFVALFVAAPVTILAVVLALWGLYSLVTVF